MSTLQIPCILGVPWDEKSSFQRGSALAPPAIRRAFHSDAGNPYSETGIDLSSPDAIHDAGDLVLPSGDGALDAITTGVRELLARGERPVSLGGDHAITFPIVKALRTLHPRLTILHFDAHPDLYDSLNGDPYSHACPFARIFEAGLADRLVSLGIRTATAHQREQAVRFNVDTIYMSDWSDGLELDLSGPVYLTVDLDVLEPGLAPGIAHREPGGATVRQVLRIIHTLDASLVGADIVECNPALDPSGVTASVAAKFLKEILGVMVR